MDVHARAGFAHGNLGSEGQRNAIFVSQLTHDPFGHHQLVDGIFNVKRQKFNLVLFVDLSSVCEVTHFGVTVFDLSRGDPILLFSLSWSRRHLGRCTSLHRVSSSGNITRQVIV